MQHAEPNREAWKLTHTAESKSTKEQRETVIEDDDVSTKAPDDEDVLSEALTATAEKHDMRKRDYFRELWDPTCRQIILNTFSRNAPSVKASECGHQCEVERGPQMAHK